jgi:phenylacetate-CoA ligase
MRFLFFKLLDFMSGYKLIKLLRDLGRETGLKENDLIKLQDERLFQLLNYAKSNSPYYADLFSDLEINRANVKEIISKTPILDKATLNLNIDRIVTKNKKKLLKQASSGSTGYRTIVYWTKLEQKLNRATQVLWWHWAGYEWNMPILQTGITPKRGVVKRFKDFLLNTYYLQAFNHNKDEIDDAIKWASSQKKSIFLAGYASSLNVIANFFGHSSFFQSAVSWGDKLFEHYRMNISEKFGCKIYETYGSAEGLMIAAQKDLPYMYIMSTHVYLEVLDEFYQPVKDGEMGHVYITNLNGFGTPLIRYKIGDLAIKLPLEEYPENRELALPLLKKIIGRDTDVVKTQNGKILVVHSFTGYFEHIDSVLQFQIIQNTLTEITIKIIVNESFNLSIKRDIEGGIMAIIQDDMLINMEIVNAIEPSPSGKPQIIISRI